MAISVIHQPDRQRFVAVLDGQECVLEYRLLPDHSVDFTRTFVPVALRGQGIAESLVRAGIGWAQEQAFEITASCWYVSRFLKRTKQR